MASRAAAEITLPQAKISLDDLLSVIRQLDALGRAKIARVLLETQMDDEMGQLLEDLSQAPSHPEVSDAEIQAEVLAVRATRAR